MRAESKAKKGKGKVGTIVLFLALPVPLWFFNPFKYNTSCEWGVRMVNEY